MSQLPPTHTGLKRIYIKPERAVKHKSHIITAHMDKVQLMLLLSFVSVAAGEVPYPIAIISVLSAIVIVVPLCCLAVVVCLVVRIGQMQGKLREANQARFVEHDYELSLSDCNTKSYKRISNVYVKMETDSKKSSDDSDTQNEIVSKENSYENSPGKICESQKQDSPLDIELDPAVENDSIYEVMTSPRQYSVEKVSPPTD